jgi:polyisoprenoid-binding protein YceI
MLIYFFVVIYNRCSRWFDKLYFHSKPLLINKIIKMKNGFLSIATVLFLASCGGTENKNNGDHHVEAETASVNSNVSGVFTVDAASSVLSWEGSKLAGTHHGVVSVTSGEVVIENGEVKQGAVSVDLATIKELDTDDEMAVKLEDHLKSAEFFNVTEFPTATITVVSVKAGVVHADLTLKGKTKSIEFPASVEVTKKSVSVTAKFSINRTDWGIVFGAGNFFTDLAKDKIISDDISFDIKIEAKK